jgi:hypothetical protein
MLRTLRLVPIVAVIVSAAGCGGNATPTSPTTTSSVVSLVGSWSGSISDAISGDGTVQLSLSDQAPNTLIGTWSATFKSGDSFAGQALAFLAPTGYGVMLYVDPQPHCAGGSAALGFTLVNVAVTSNRLTAAAGRTSCNGTSFGTITLAKQ